MNRSAELTLQLILKQLRMKPLATLLFILVSLIGLSQDITPNVTAALQKGDATAIKSLCTASVDLAIPGHEDVFPADQAEKLLKKFFEAHKPISFEVKHQGTSKLNDLYRIGDLTTSTGKYRVTFFIKNGDGGMKIKQLRIEEFEDDF
jgi:hypothetical protein